MRQLDQEPLLKLVGYNARRAYLPIHQLFGKRMARFALKPAEFSALALIAHNQPVTQKELAAALSIPSPNMVVLIDKLEARGVVTRVQSSADKRVWLISTTTKGSALAKEAGAVAQALEQEASAALSAPERAQLIKLLQRLF